MMHRKKTASWIALPVLLLAAGCGSASTGEGTGQTQAAAQTPAGMQKTGCTAKFRAHARAAFLLERAVGKLDLQGAQKTKVQNLIAELEQKPVHPPLAGHADLRSVLRSGKVDTAALNQRVTAVEANVRARVNKTADVLNRLHAALTAPQRALLVEQLKSEFAGLRHHHRAWHAHARRHRRGHWLAKKLGLSAAQIAALKAQAPARPEGKRHHRGALMHKLLAAFVQEQFDAHQLLDANAIAARRGARVQRRVQRMAALSSVLTVEQRAKLNTLMQARRQHLRMQRAPLAHPSLAK